MERDPKHTVLYRHRGFRLALVFLGRKHALFFVTLAIVSVAWRIHSAAYAYPSTT